MAKQPRSGLGRGLNSLLGGPSEAAPASGRTTERDRIVYDEREDVVYENNVKSQVIDNEDPGATGRFGAVGNPRENVSRETSEQISTQFQPIQPEEVVERVVVEEVAEEPKEEALAGNMIYEVDIEKVAPNPDQPRTNFDEEDLKELSNSIKREGLIQPILAREMGDGTFQIIAGERRWQASKRAGLKTVPVQVKNVDDDKALELALIENIQRTDLNPIEEAYAYKRLMERNKMTQADIAQAVSKGRSTIANALRLLELPEEAQKLLFEDQITAGHARAILSAPKENRSSLTQKVIDNNLSVREAEQLARLMSNKPEKGEKREPTPALYKSVARALKASLGAPVKVKSSKGKNKIEIEFTDEQDLERLFNLINPE